MNQTVVVTNIDAVEGGDAGMFDVQTNTPRFDQPDVSDGWSNVVQSR